MSILSGWRLDDGKVNAERCAYARPLYLRDWKLALRYSNPAITSPGRRYVHAADDAAVNVLIALDALDALGYGFIAAAAKASVIIII